MRKPVPYLEHPSLFLSVYCRTEGEYSSYKKMTRKSINLTLKYKI